MTLMLGFDPVLSGRDNALFGGMLLGFSRSEVRHQIEAMKEFSGLGTDFEKPVGGYSSGMVARLSFSVAINLEPDVMLIDEVLAVGDESFRKKAYAAMSGKITSEQTAVFVSHSAGEIEKLCDRVILLDGGRLLDCGEPASMIAEYRKLMADS
jgi:lipopolysaccharide transport system ATP-binding protein